MTIKSYDGIKSFEELNEEELEVFGTFRNLKIANDKLTLELIRYILNDLLEKYNPLFELRKDIQIKYFGVMAIIAESKLNARCKL